MMLASSRHIWGRAWLFHNLNSSDEVKEIGEMISEQYDLIVVGGGLAGLIAANRASELQLLKIVVLEKGTGEAYPCNSRLTGGVFHIAFHDITAPPQKLEEAIKTAIGGHADPQFGRALSENAGRCIEWLAENGARFVDGGRYAWMSRILAPPSLQEPGLHWEGRGGDVLLRTLAQRLLVRKGHFRSNARASALVVQDGRCVGVIAQVGNENLTFRARAVLIADGGFQGNYDLVRRHISPKPDKLCMRGAGTGCGDGLLMAEKIGAKLVGLDRFYGHVQCREALHSNAFWPYPVLDLITSAGIVVNSHGRRFADEGLGGVYLANAIAALDEPDSAVVVFDHAIWLGPGRDYILPPNPNVLDAGAELLSADKLDALAAKIGIPADALNDSVNAHNANIYGAAVSNGLPPRSLHLAKPHPIKTPRYYALRLCAGITYTMGGVATDTEGRVLNHADYPIPGLYAAGSTTGGLEGGPHAGYVGGLSKASVFALRAAEAAAVDLR